MLTTVPLATWPVLVEQVVGTGWGLMDDGWPGSEGASGFASFSGSSPSLWQMGTRCVSHPSPAAWREGDGPWWQGGQWGCFSLMHW